MSDQSAEKAALKNPRRQFLGHLGLMGAGAVLAGCAPTLANQPVKPNLDVNILNFALNLEYLEAAFYLAATGRLEELYAVDANARGKILVDSDVAARTSAGLTLTGVTREVAHEIASDELAHVRFLRTALGTSAVTAPTIDIRRATFQAAANAAAGSTLNPAFDPYLNDLFFLHGAFIFEDVGVSAYKGAARFLVDDKAGGILEQAAGILAVEAYHSGAIRHELYRRHRAGETTPYGPISNVVQLISNLRDSVDGTDDRDQGIVATNADPAYVAGPNGITQSNVVLADMNAVAFSRTPRQVANIVFLTGDSTKTTGGFFPQGLSGNFSTLLSL